MKGQHRRPPRGPSIRASARSRTRIHGVAGALAPGRGTAGAVSRGGLLLGLLLPTHCTVCGAPRAGFGGGGVCDACWDALPTIEPAAACPTCALPGDGSRCAGCRREAPPVAAACALGLYAGRLKRLVGAFKFAGHDVLAPAAARRLAGRLRQAGPVVAEAVVPVPSTRSRNRERGYDPGAELGRALAAELRLPCRRLLARTRDGAPQSSLPAARRRANVAGVFRASPGARGKRLLLVDDVLTTGATAFEAARTLLAAGASRVDLAVLARTPEPGEEPAESA